jgi:hypothetical protein
LNRTHQLLVNADDVTIVGENLKSIKKNTEALSKVSKEAGLEVNREMNLSMWLGPANKM